MLFTKSMTPGEYAAELKSLGEVLHPQEVAVAIVRDFGMTTRGKTQRLKSRLETRCLDVMKGWSEAFASILPCNGRRQAFSVLESGGKKGLKKYRWRFNMDGDAGHWGFKSYGFPDAPGKRTYGLISGVAAIGDAREISRDDVCVAKGSYRVGFASEGNESGAVELLLTFDPMTIGGKRMHPSRVMLTKSKLKGLWVVERAMSTTPTFVGKSFAECIKDLQCKRITKALVTRDAFSVSDGLILVDVAKLAPRIARIRSVVSKKDEQRYTLGVAYPSSEVDAHNEYATEKEVELAAWKFLVRSPKVGLMHKDGTEGAGQVVESYIYRGPDWTMNDQTVKSGDWLLGVVWDEKAWGLIKEGTIRGFSMQGYAKRGDEE